MNAGCNDKVDEETIWADKVRFNIYIQSSVSRTVANRTVAPVNTSPQIKDIFQRYLRMMVSLIPGSFLAILYRFFRTPLDAREALFTVMKPYRFPHFQINIPARADLFTDAACIALVIGPKILIHCRNIGKRELVEPGKEDILP